MQQTNGWTDDRLSRSDARMVAKAAREGWAVPGKVKRAIVAALSNQIDGSDGRTLAAIASALTSMDRADIAAARLALDIERTQPPDEVRIRIVQEDQP